MVTVGPVVFNAMGTDGKYCRKSSRSAGWAAADHNTVWWCEKL